MTKQDDGLFLLEVLVDKIIFIKSPCFSDKDFRTCVNIQAPSVEPLEICDDDPGVCTSSSGGPFVKSFNNGKSCLFSLKQSDINSAMSSFPIKICVYKSLPCGCLPTKIIMGEATIDMTKEFVEARKKFLEDPNTVSYQALKDSFTIVGTDGAPNGEILMFLRISCFGKLIITKFQGATGPPKLGDATKSGIIDRSCNPQRNFQTAQDPCACGTGRSAGAGTTATGAPPCLALGGGGGAPCPIMRDPYNSMPCEDTDDICYCSGPKPARKPPMICRNTDQYCLHVPKDCCPPGNKVIFQLPQDPCEGHKQRAYFNFTSDGIGDVSRDEPGQLVPASSEDYQGVINDFSSQVIKLRIAKTVEMANRKSKFEYQFITPAVTHEKVVPVTDTRTAQCLPTCDCCSDRCVPSGLPLCQDSSEARGLDTLSSQLDNKQDTKNDELEPPSSRNSQAKLAISNCLQDFFNKSQFSLLNCDFTSTEHHDYPGILQLKTQTVRTDFIDTGNSNKKSNLSQQETTVYLTLINDHRFSYTSGTQATAYINKCLQVSKETINEIKYLRSSPSTFGTKSDVLSTTTMSTRSYKAILRNSDVYFFGSKKSAAKSGMEKTDSNTSQNKPSRCPGHPPRITRTAAGISIQANCSNSCSVWAQTHCAVGSSAGTNTSKSVCIKDDRCPAESDACSPECTKTGGLSAIVSHIRIGPPQFCQGAEPCTGPNCILATSAEDEKAPVKVSTVTNPRRGVFELVIRQLNGAPLARNELMLEWTPPPPRPSSCNSPCSVPCSFIPSCRPTKCKMIVCRPSSCKPKCRDPCKKPCRPPSTCFAPFCSPYPCQKPCRKPCRSPCAKPCTSPCRSSCYKPCRSLCRTPCYKPLHTPICFVTPCPPPCFKPCRSPCQNPCDRPCRSPCPRPKRRCRSPCRPKRCRSPCRSPCRPIACCAAPCRVPRRPSPFRPKCQPSSCGSPCASPCRPCSPCKPALPCGQPCATPCCDSVPCGSPCSSPCLQLCPVGRRRPRRCRSQPRIRSHKKRISPCRNRSRYCPIVRCKSFPGPCSNCCGPVACPPPKFCSGFPYKPKCCKSTCSSCCA